MQKLGLRLYLEKFEIARCKIPCHFQWKLLKKRKFLRQLIAISAVTKAPNSATILGFCEDRFRLRFKLQISHQKSTKLAVKEVEEKQKKLLFFHARDHASLIASYPII
jgi:hypothetical protein